MCSRDSPAKIPQPVITEMPQAYPSLRQVVFTVCAHLCHHWSHPFTRVCIRYNNAWQPRPHPAPSCARTSALAALPAEAQAGLVSVVLLPAGLLARNSWARGAAASPGRGRPGRWRRLREAGRTGQELVPGGRAAQVALERSTSRLLAQKDAPHLGRSRLRLQNFPRFPKGEGPAEAGPGQLLA